MFEHGARLFSSVLLKLGMDLGVAMISPGTSIYETTPLPFVEMDRLIANVSYTTFVSSVFTKGDCTHNALQTKSTQNDPDSVSFIRSDNELW